MELREILQTHAAKYPKMQPTDAVKLIYQNEFGGGHMISDEKACLAYLAREYASVEKNPQIPLYEEIGNGILRVNLAAVAEKDLEQLGHAFIRSAQMHKGELSRFLKKLETLKELTLEGLFDFTVLELQEYLDDYRQAGYPTVSHSEQYRQNYHPAYRVVRAEFIP